MYATEHVSRQSVHTWQKVFGGNGSAKATEGRRALNSTEVAITMLNKTLLEWNVSRLTLELLMIASLPSMAEPNWGAYLLFRTVAPLRN